PSDAQFSHLVTCFYSDRHNLNSSSDYEINLYLREQMVGTRGWLSTETQLCGVEFMKLPDRAWDKIWVPDVFFRNEKKAAFHEVTLPNRLMRLFYPNGTVYYALITATLSCQMKLHKYPLDTQSVTRSRPMFTKWRQMPVETDEQLILPQFELHATNTRNCQQTYATGDYPCLERHGRVDEHLPAVRLCLAARIAVVNVFSRKEIRKKVAGPQHLSETAKNFEEMIMR
uniref:Neur_chan_LBD domain-containing protein n=1 Tax=Macrostomum lignano TaxID=282301 RepID=A0A1I8F9S4_9PLAT